MANHVYFNVNVKTNDPKVEKAFEEVMVMEEITRPFYASEDTYTVKELIDIDRLAFMPEGKYDSDDYLENSWDYYVNNVGAKWCHIEDVDHDNLFFSGYSAWSPPIQLIENLQNYLEGYGEVSIRMTYDDEGWCFVGVANGEGDCEELEDSDIDGLLLEELDLEELPDDWEDNEEIFKKLGDIEPREWLENKIYEWQDEIDL